MRAGLIGLGMMGRHHARVLASLGAVLGKENEIVTMRQGAATVEVAVAVAESAATGRVVALEQGANR